MSYEIYLTRVKGAKVSGEINEWITGRVNGCMHSEHSVILENSPERSIPAAVGIDSFELF